MKKHILLTTTAMILSAVALKANAEASNTAQLEIAAQIISPFELKSEQYLGFGMILADEGNKTVIVTTDGKLNPDSTATMLSTASFKNYNSNGYLNRGSLNEGIIRIMNIGRYFEEFEANLYKLSTSNNIVLIENESGRECGVVTGLNTKWTKDGEDVLAHIGGTLTTANLSHLGPHDGPVQCNGKTTVTLIINGDAIREGYNSVE